MHPTIFPKLTFTVCERQFCRAPRQPMLLGQAECPFRAANMRPTGTGTDATHAGGGPHATIRTTTQVMERETKGRQETALVKVISSSANLPSLAGGATPHTTWEDAMAADLPTPMLHPGERWQRYSETKSWLKWTCVIKQALLYEYRCLHIMPPPLECCF